MIFMADEDIVKVEGFRVRIWKADEVYNAEVLELPGCINFGQTREEAIKKIEKTIGAYLLVVAEEAFKKREKDKVVPIGAARKRAKK